MYYEKSVDTLAPRLNIYYLLLEKLNSFADDCKYDISNQPGAQIVEEYEGKRTDAWSLIENLGIIKRIVSVCKYCADHHLAQTTNLQTIAARLVQQSRAQNQTLGRQTSSSALGSTSPALRAAPAPARSISSASSFKKTAPPPPSSSVSLAPPPYSATSSVASAASSAAATKRAPPPPPPLKPKPKAAPQIKYVVALYDFAAQVRFSGNLSRNLPDFQLDRRRSIVQCRRQNRACGEDGQCRRLVDWADQRSTRSVSW